MTWFWQHTTRLLSIKYSHHNNNNNIHSQKKGYRDAPNAYLGTVQRYTLLLRTKRHHETKTFVEIYTRISQKYNKSSQKSMIVLLGTLTGLQKRRHSSKRVCFIFLLPRLLQICHPIEKGRIWIYMPYSFSFHKTA